MKYKLESRKLIKDEFLNFKEEDLMFITNPGRMGDEDGSTFIMKDNDKLYSYRADGWMYPSSRDENFISLRDMSTQFPKWRETWENSFEDGYDGKYIYINMGFGNGLAVDKSIYNEYEPFLLEEVEKVKIEMNETEVKPNMYYTSWGKALKKMVESKGEINE